MIYQIVQGYSEVLLGVQHPLHQLEKFLAIFLSHTLKTLLNVFLMETNKWLLVTLERRFAGSELEGHHPQSKYIICLMDGRAFSNEPISDPLHLLGTDESFFTFKDPLIGCDSILYEGFIYKFPQISSSADVAGRYVPMPVVMSS